MMPPKSRQQPRAKKIKIGARESWEQILREVDKNEIPITVLQSIKVNLTDGTVVDIPIRNMINDGHLPNQIQDKLNRQLDELTNYIEDIDFFVDVDVLAKTVQPLTDSILRRITKS